MITVALSRPQPIRDVGEYKACWRDAHCSTTAFIGGARELMIDAVIDKLFIYMNIGQSLQRTTRLKASHGERRSTVRKPEQHSSAHFMAGDAWD